jgi:hypothetical protein
MSLLGIIQPVRQIVTILAELYRQRTAAYNGILDSDLDERKRKEREKLQNLFTKRTVTATSL